MEPIYEKVTGPHGTAEPMDIPDIPQAAETVAHWLLTSPDYHPLFSQWILCAVRLRDDIDGFPAPHHQFEGTTHEILCITLNPESGPYDADKISLSGDLPRLEPPNVIVQIIADDDEVRPVVSLLAQAVIHGALSPESLWTAGFDKALNERWLTSITKTLAHQRGEAHAP